MSDSAPLPAVSPAASSALQDAQGAYSSRRVGAFVALGCLALAFVAVLGCIVGAVVSGKPPDAAVVELMKSLIQVMAASAIGGLALATADRFAPK